MNYKEFSIVDHGGTFSCIPSVLLADAVANEQAIRLVSSALQAGPVTLGSVREIAGDNDQLQEATYAVIRRLLQDCTDSDEEWWNEEEIWVMLMDAGKKSGEMPEHWEPTLEDLSTIEVRETEFLYDFAGLLSTDWASFLPEEVLELAEIHSTMAASEKMWFDDKNKSEVINTLNAHGYSVSE